MIARKIVAAGPQRRERRVEPRAQFDERARPAAPCPCARTTRTRSSFDIGRAPLMLVHAEHDAIAALALLARFDKAGQRHVEAAGAASTGCAMRAVFQVASVKPAAIAATASATGKASGRARSANAAAQAASASDDRPTGRLAIGGRNRRRCRDRKRSAATESAGPARYRRDRPVAANGRRRFAAKRDRVMRPSAVRRVTLWRAAHATARAPRSRPSVRPAPAMSPRPAHDSGRAMLQGQEPRLLALTAQPRPLPSPRCRAARWCG